MIKREAKTPRHYSTYRGYRRVHSILGYPDRDWFGVEAKPHTDYPILIKKTSERGEVHYIEVT